MQSARDTYTICTARIDTEPPAMPLGGEAEVARDLAYRLYTVCERKKRAAEALSYNALVQSWPEIVRLANEGGPAAVTPAPTLFDQD